MEIGTFLGMGGDSLLKTGLITNSIYCYDPTRGQTWVGKRLYKHQRWSHTFSNKYVIRTSTMTSIVYQTVRSKKKQINKSELATRPIWGVRSAWRRWRRFQGCRSLLFREGPLCPGWPWRRDDRLRDLVHDVSQLGVPGRPPRAANLLL